MIKKEKIESQRQSYEDVFLSLYKTLNPEQKKAVDTIDGPVMVIAGPGTGKTQVLTLRIANILRKTDILPGSILALTFTESGAYSMRKRLLEIIGSSAYKVSIHTFHSFCNEVIQRYPEEFPRRIGSSKVTESDQIKAMEKIIERSHYKKIKTFGNPFFHIRSILDAIRSLKREGVSPKAFEKLVREQKSDFKKIPDLYHSKSVFKGEMKGKYRDLEKSIEKNNELHDAYKKYEKMLRVKRWIDFEDMIMEVTRELRDNRDLLLRLQEEYQYILADEHQDANTSQNQLLELLGNFHENPNIFIVGDEKQAIFRFQGASLENFLYFKKLYPKALVIEFKENYRSPQHILDSAYSLILNNQGETSIARVPLKSNKKPENGKIILRQFSKPEYEYAFLASDIQNKIRKGVILGEIALLYRDNKDAFPIVKALEKKKIPYSVESSQDVLADLDIGKLIHIVKTIHNYGDDGELAKMLHIDFLHIDPIDVYRLIRYGREKKVSLYAVLRSKKMLENAHIENSAALLDISLKLIAWNSASHNILLTDFFEMIVKDSGFLDYVVSGKTALDTFNKLNDLFDEVKKIVEAHKTARLSDFIYYLEIIRNYKVLLKMKESRATRFGVHLMTAHRAKGQEYDYVYIVGMHDKHWGNQREMRSFHLPIPGHALFGNNSIDDERRLFYVALTRAKKQAVLSFSEVSENKERQLPSQFIEEIDKKLIEVVDTKKDEERLEIAPSAYGFRVKDGLSLNNLDYLKNLFLEQGLSVSALNNYLECPWRYFFRSLIRIPEVQDKTALYGTAVHSALARFFNTYRIEEDITRKQLIDSFKQFLNRMPLSESDVREAEMKGTRSLGGYYDVYKGNWIRNCKVEYNITGVFLDVPFSDKNSSILLKGKLDKIEFLGEKDVRVVDYKTSKPKTRKEIEGKTKNSLGNLKRQLVFYKLLLEKHSQLNWCMKEGMLDFIEPNEKGEYKREIFTIEKEEVEKLEEEIKKVSREIYTFEFWDSICDEKKCDYCRLRRLMVS